MQVKNVSDSLYLTTISGSDSLLTVLNVMGEESPSDCTTYPINTSVIAEVLI